MKKILLPLFLCALAAGCKTEKDVEPANASTFIKYFGSENSHTALVALEADNGYALLSNVDFPVGTLGDFKYKIRFIHTDQNGNLDWQKVYPALSTYEPGLDGYKAASFIAVEDGYIIVGERINIDENKVFEGSELLLQKIDLSGEVVWQTFLSSPNGNLHGRAVVKAPASPACTECFFVLGFLTERTTPNDMYVARIDASNPSAVTKVWDREYGSDSGSVLNRLYTGPGSSIIWGGSVDTGSPDIRLVIAPENALGSQVQRTCCDPVSAENAYDFCETLGGYAFVGSQVSNTTGNDIFFTKLSTTGRVIVQPETPFDFDGQNDRGVSICPSPDGGFMILATVQSGLTKGFGEEDIFLYKVNDQGEEEAGRSINYGGSGADEAASIRTTSDGAYLVFGTTTFGSLKKLVLMKVDRNGKIGS